MNTEQFYGHTPEPWVAQCGSVYTKASVGEDGYATVCVARMDREEPSTFPTERDANARLIAAAPDLLAEVKRLRSIAVALLKQEKQMLAEILWEDTEDELWGLVNLLDYLQDLREEIKVLSKYRDIVEKYDDALLADGDTDPRWSELYD